MNMIGHHTSLTSSLPIRGTKRWVAIGSCLLSFGLSAQVAQHCRTRDELVKSNALIPAYDHGQSLDTTMNALMRNIYIGDRPSGYIALIDERTIHENKALPLQYGEGARGYRFEANTDLFFVLSSGRHEPRFLVGGHRTGVYFNNTVRMTRDPSSPLLPGNWKIGLAGEIPLHLSHFRNKKAAYDSLVDVRRTQIKEAADSTLEIRFLRKDEYLVLLKRRNGEVAAANARSSNALFLKWHLFHYSNGQDTGFYDNASVLRNDYNSGDFSTNCFTVEAVYARRYNVDTTTTGSNLITLGAGFRRDLGAHEGTLAFSREQEFAYGRARLIGHAQWRSKPFWLRAGKWPRLYVVRRHQDPGSHIDCRSHRLGEYAEFRARVEVEGIVDRDLGLYPGEDKYRWGTHLWLELNTMRSYATGFFVHAYYGRDYLNIRYDRAVSLIMAGLSFHIYKYVPFGWRPAGTIK